MDSEDSGTLKTMTKRDFDSIAKAIATVVTGQAVPYPIRWIAENIADYCQTQNPNFDRDRFLRACEVAD